MRRVPAPPLRLVVAHRRTLCRGEHRLPRVATGSWRAGFRDTDRFAGRTVIRREPSRIRRRRESRVACHPATQMGRGVRGRDGVRASPVGADQSRRLIWRPRRLALQAPAATTACGASPREASADIGPALRSDPGTRALCGSARETEPHPVPTMAGYHPDFAGGKARALPNLSSGLFSNFDSSLLHYRPVE